MKNLSRLGLLKKPCPPSGDSFSEAVGYLDSKVRPDRYEANYPNMAWDDMTEADAIWAARLLAGYSEEQIRTAVDLARYSRGKDSDYIFKILLERRQRILEYYKIP